MIMRVEILCFPVIPEISEDLQKVQTDAYRLPFNEINAVILENSYSEGSILTEFTTTKIEIINKNAFGIINSRKKKSKFYRRHYKLISKFNVWLKVKVDNDQEMAQSDRNRCLY